MELITMPFLFLILSIVLTVCLTFYVLSRRPLKQLHKNFSYILACILIISTGVGLQSIFSSLFDVNPYYFENFIYIGTCFLPVAFFFAAMNFRDTKIKFVKRYLLVFIIPVLSLIILWTNNLHHLFYVTYSGDMSLVSYGSYFFIHSIYTYVLLFISMGIIIRSSFKNSGFFSMQSILLIFGSIVPVVINILGTFKVINMNVYLTPISFSVTIMLYAFAIFKYSLLNVAPVAIQRIVDVMSDSYLVLDVNGYITDFNGTFARTFKLENNSIRNKLFFDILAASKNIRDFKDAYYSSIDEQKTSILEYFHPSIRKYFNVEISPLYNNQIFIGSLILFKDITQHINDMKQLKDSQETLMESERLASLGQLIGGIAHNLKTPIMSISGATEGITDLIKEYDSSIDDPEVNSNDHHEIASEMLGWTSKIKEYTEYMSDIITAVKGQAVVMSEGDNINFDIDELVKRINILMRHELKNAIVYLNVSMLVPGTTSLHGDINSLIQVINNMISNSIQAYDGIPNQKIDLILEKNSLNQLVISVKDYGPGLPEKVKQKLFSEMITTKGKNGTGLGLYMSYSTIKAHFGGDITFESENGKGTVFHIILPMHN